MTDRLAGKTAVITGAGSGLGRATAELFAAEGANVLVADRWQERAERIAAGIGAQAAPFVGDVSQGEDVQAMFSAPPLNAGAGSTSSTTTPASPPLRAPCATAPSRSSTTS